MVETSLYMLLFRFITEMSSTLSAVFLFCARLAVYSILGSLIKQSLTATTTMAV